MTFSFIFSRKLTQIIIINVTATEHLLENLVEFTLVHIDKSLSWCAIWKDFFPKREGDFLAFAVDTPER